VDNALAKVSQALRATKLKSATAVFVVETGLPRFDPHHLDAVMRRHFDVVDYLFIARRQDKLVSSIIAQHMKCGKEGGRHSVHAGKCSKSAACVIFLP